MSINASDSLPSFQLANIGFYTSSTVPTFATSQLTALCISTTGGTSTTVYVTINNGTSWAAITSA